MTIFDNIYIYTSGRVRVIFFFNLKRKTGDIEVSFFDSCLPRSESGGVENYRFCVTSGSFHQSFVF